MQFIPIPQSRGPRYARCWRSGVEERERNPYDLPCSSAPLSFVFSGSSMLKFLFLRLLCLTLYFPLFPPFLCVEGLAFGTKNSPERHSLFNPVKPVAELSPDS